MGDVELVGDQAGSLTAQTAPRHTVLFALKFTRAIAQREAVHTVNLAGKQAILWFTEDQFAVEQHFTQRYTGFFGIKAGSDIGKQTVFFFYFIDMQLPAFMACYRIARIEHHAGHGGITARIQTVFARR
ncbi:hypothetical protein CIT292_09417 [Citrobacter youngae ATCC 29220]|uniref:Uncharacterized protein n=1 Tax=Citrobacter youngae ATCC 29220 TaxID=500640 RepID=D4BF51_9ENTR|nr:hypothetical protein CIT292_09417 [Citrobacter youngae ATCC 29220]